MIFKFVFTGKTSDKWIEEGCVHYINRINRYIKTQIVVINTASIIGSPELQKKKEVELILSKVEDKEYVVLLDAKGRQFSSEEFSLQINKLINSGKSTVTFIIGGAFGSDSILIKRANLLLSFSKMTFTHQMVRLIMLEQVYRGFTILKNEKYHH